MKIDTNWLNEAIEIVSRKLAEKLVKGNVTVYRVKNTIRIDIKEV